MSDLYAVVQKPLKPKEKKEEKPVEEEDEDVVPPPLPSRPDFEAEEDQKKSQENTVGQEATEKPKGVGIIKSIQKHMRNISDGTGPPTKTDEEKSLNGKKALVEGLSSDNKKSLPPPKAYLITDIINLQPSTKMFGEPEMYESGAHDEDEPISSSNFDLPDGWKEVNDAEGTYYWHVASGTTQWQKPKVNIVLK